MSNDGSEVSPFSLRRAQLADAGSAAEIYITSSEASVPYIPPLTHTSDEIHRWLRDIVLTCEVWLAEGNGQAQAVMVLDGDELGQLYVHPRCQGRGVGAALVRLAQSRRPGGLSLWTFQSNRGAQRFYERHGFVEVERTDGSGNDEQAPDIRFEWHAQPPLSTHS